MYICKCLYIFICTYIYVHVCVCVCMCVCACVSRRMLEAPTTKEPNTNRFVLPKRPNISGQTYKESCIVHNSIRIFYVYKYKYIYIYMRICMNICI